MARGDRFVNPFTFVPLSGTSARSAPPGHAPNHAEAATRYSGHLTVTWTCETPLLLPAEVAREARRNGPPGAPATVRLPGSSVKGAVRSVHEAMFNGCLRVFDPTFRPAYRDSLAPDLLESWRLAVVTAARDGRPTKVRVCEGEPVWIEATGLLAEYQRRERSIPMTGDVITYGDRPEEGVNRKEIRSLLALEQVMIPNRDDVASETWWDDRAQERASVVLVTDTAARRDFRKLPDGRRGRGRAYWATGRIGRETLDVPDDVAAGYAYACAGARDVTSAKTEEQAKACGENVFAEVQWWDNTTGRYFRGGNRTVVARRMKVTGYLHPGAVVWIRSSGTEVTAIKVSSAWRTVVQPGAGVKGRGWQAATGCADRDRLCPSCATFGMVDSEADRGTRQGSHQAYGGHVRFGEAIAEQVRLQDITLAPLGTPSPGAAGMYLQAAKSAGGPRGRGDMLSRWDSDADNAGRRGIRGRKFYWHSDPDEQARHWREQTDRPVQPRYQARPHHQARTGGMRGETRQLVRAGTTFTQRITVDALDWVGVATLISALDPSRAIRAVQPESNRAIAHHLGGGKPFGLGTVTPAITEISLWRGADRYTGGAPVPVAEFAADIPRIEARCSDVRSNIGQVAIALDRAALGEDRHLVWYPPKGTWADVGTQRFDESYEFFREYSGEQLAGPNRPFFPLPPLSPAPGSQRLPNATGLRERDRR